MTFYQELQLNQAGSKEYIASFRSPKEKCKHIGIYLFKIIITVAFGTAFITLFSMLFGKNNSIVGLAVLLCITSFRFSDFGIRTSHAVFCVFIIFGILAAGPKLSNSVPLGASFCINIIFIMLLMLFGSHNVVMFNHSTFVLSYLMILGYNVSGHDYEMRLAGLFIGAVLTSVILYRNHRKIKYKRTLKNLFQEFDMSSTRTRWQLQVAFGVSGALLIASVLGVSKAYWMGIAAMSVTMPFRNELTNRAKYRGFGSILGCILFLLAYIFLPKEYHVYMGIIGGIGTGLSAHYGWQTAFNAFGALSVSVPVLGLGYAIGLRLFNNIFASLYIWVFDRIFKPFLSFISNLPLYYEKVKTVER